MKYVLSNPTAINSAEILAMALSEVTNDSWTSTTDKYIRINNDFIRYGNCKPISPFSGKDLNVNRRDFIYLCANKAHFSHSLVEKGYYSPTFYAEVYRNGKVTIEEPKEFPVLIRTTLTGKEGKGIIVCENEQEFLANWRNNYFWTKYIPTEFELRVHVANGKILRIFKKLPPEIEEKYPIRNNARGYHFSLVRTDLYKRVSEIVTGLSTFPEFSGQFYALDMGWDKINKKYFIYEANSCPGMNENTARAYAIELGKQLGYEVKENELSSSNN